MIPHLVWNGWSHRGWWPAVLLLAALGAATLIAILYRYERRLVPAAVGRTLLVVRLAVIAMLGLVLFEPVLSRTHYREHLGRVVVAVDVSESMTTRDVHASKGEKLRWARGLGLVGNPGIDARLDRWQAAWDAGREPAWVDPREKPDADQREALAKSRRANLEAVFSQVDKLSRKEIARRLLMGRSASLLAELEKLGQVQLVTFAGGIATTDAKTLPEVLETPPTSLAPHTSDLNLPLSAALAGNSATPLMGVVLLTDGRDNAERLPTSAAQRLGQLQAPVYPVALGSKLRPKDLSIGDLEYPQTVFKDDQPLLKVTLNTAGFESDELQVTLEPAEGEPVTKSVTAQGPSATLEFPLTGQAVGRHDFTVKTDVRAGETRADNNTQSFSMTVVDDKVRVMLIENEARWEFRFIDNALKRDSRVELETILFQQPHMGLLPDTLFRNRLDFPPDGLLENSPFAAADLIILGDVSPANLPLPAWELLEKFVSESGGTLVLTAGKRHFPQAFRAPIVEQLLPVTNLAIVDLNDISAAAPPTERGFKLRLTPDGEGEPMLQFDADPTRNRAIWSALPGHLWGLVGHAKPGATVYGYAYRPGVQDPLQIEREQAVIVQQHYGTGQVLWLGIDSTWRWRHRAGDTYHHRFWGQLGRWAADNKAAAGNEFVKFGPDRSDIQTGEDALFRARWVPQFVKKFPQLKARVELYRAGAAPGAKPFSTLDLTPDPDRPLVHEARAVGLQPGQYRATLIVTGADMPSNELAARLDVHEPQSAELRDLSANLELLQQLAEASGGQLCFPDSADRIPALLKNPRKTTAELEETRLWDHWLVLVMLFALLTVEWVVRKLNGLP